MFPTRFKAFFPVLVFSLATVTSARADMGSVWVVSTSKNSITIDWEVPSGAHLQYGTTYTVCWQQVHEDNALRRVCSTNSDPINYKPYVIYRLDSGKEYRIQVMNAARKRIANGDFINPKDRKVGEIRQMTDSDEDGQNLEVVEAEPTSLTVRFKSDVELDHDTIRIAYVEKWNTDLHLNEAASDPNGPDGHWGVSSASSGWEDFYFPADEQSGSFTEITFPYLSRCQAYELVVYGLYVDHDRDPVWLASTMGRTAGHCPQTTVDDAVAADHEEILESYALELSNDPVIVDFGGDFPWVRVAQVQFLEDAPDDIQNSVTLLQFLIQEKPDDYASWQETASVTLSDFVEQRHVELFEALQSELDPEPVLFLRGDANDDTHTDISDAVAILGFLFQGGTRPVCMDSADVDDNGRVEITDAVRVLAYLFQGGDRPDAPYPDCGEDPTPRDGLFCGQSSSACPVSS